MKKNYATKMLLGAALFTAGIGSAQNYYYTWMKGDYQVDQAGVYGTQGTAAALNTPGAREEPSRWTDASGNFWLFGGYGFDASGTSDLLNDLWKYNPSTNQWTWIKGDNSIDQDGVYGTQGTAAATNKPGSREGAVTWTDASGNFWMFGGIGQDAFSNIAEMNDLWKYNPATNQWTWMKGSNSSAQNAVYGTQGTAAAANTPGARTFPVAWSDASGNFWLFGGSGYDAAGNYGDLNDLWKYNTATNQWTWMSGSSAIGLSGTYGTQGTPAAANIPGARYMSTGWLDASGNFILFGGIGYDANSGLEDLLNDLWRYNPATNQWTWMSGSNSSGQFGVYGTMGTPAASNIPGGRFGSTSWSDASGNLWLFGGVAYAGMNVDVINDLWRYNVATNQWTWLQGSNSVGPNGVYGTQGMAGILNTPGGRAGLVSWKDASGNAWLFGGAGNDATGTYDDLNDLWRISNCAGPATITVAYSNTLCLGGSSTLTASGASVYAWSNNQTGSVTVVTPSVTGITTLTVDAANAAGCPGTTTVAITTNSLPVVAAATAVSTICIGSSAILTASGASSYTWNTTPAVYTATMNVTPAVNTTYTVTGKNSSGCSATATITQLVSTCTGILENAIVGIDHQLYPNPSNGAFNISSAAFNNNSKLVIFNALGQQVASQSLTAGNNAIQVHLAKGIYSYNLLQDNKPAGNGKLVIE